MTEYPPMPESQENGFVGRHVNIQLASDEGLTEQLAAHDQTQTFLDLNDEDILPYPARLVKLESWYSEDPDTPKINGVITFRPTTLERFPNT